MLPWGLRRRGLLLALVVAAVMLSAVTLTLLVSAPPEWISSAQLHRDRLLLSQAVSQPQLRAFTLAESWIVAPWGSGTADAGDARLLSLHWADVNDDSCPDVYLLSSLSNASLLSVSYLLNRCGKQPEDVAFKAMEGKVIEVPQRGQRKAGSVSAISFDLDRDYASDLIINFPSEHQHFPCALDRSARRFNSASSAPLVVLLAPKAVAKVHSRSAPWLRYNNSLPGGGLTMPKAVLPPVSASASVRTGRAMFALDWNLNGAMELLRSSVVNATTVLYSSIGSTDSNAAVNGTVNRCLTSEQTAAMFQTRRGCSIMLLAHLDTDLRIEFVCFGPTFPDELSVYHYGRRQWALEDVTARYGPHALEEGDHTLQVRDACMADINADGLADYIIASSRGIVVWRSVAGGAGSEQLRYVQQPLWPGWAQDEQPPAVSVACLDVDNDGDIDVFALYGLKKPPSDPEAAAAANVDALSKASAFFLNERNTGALHFAFSLPFASSSSFAAPPQVVTVGDYNQDGRLDLLLAHESGALQLWRNDFVPEPANRWLTVALYGVGRSNTGGRGAFVRALMSDGRSFTRIITPPSASSSFTRSSPYGQSHHLLHLGLGSRQSVVEELQVYWPHPPASFKSNRMQYYSVHSNQHLQVLELSDSTVLSSRVRRLLSGPHAHFRNFSLCSRAENRRVSPSFFLIGQWQCGIKTLTAALYRHPRVLRSSSPELQYFGNLDRAFDLDWYSSQFACGHLRTHVTFDASASYLFDTDAPHRLLSAFPAARLVVLLRDPVERAFAQYRLECRASGVVGEGNSSCNAQHFHEEMSWGVDRFKRCVRGYQVRTPVELTSVDLLAASNSPFFQMLSDCSEKYSLVNAGLYAVMLGRWLRELNSTRVEQLLVLSFEQMLREPDAVLQAVQQHVGLEASNRTSSSIHSGGIELRNVSMEYQMQNRTVGKLRSFYRPFNFMLQQMVRFHNNQLPHWIMWQTNSTDRRRPM